MGINYLVLKYLISPSTDQNNENFTFSQSIADVHVVSFIFTRCPDVCPVITQSLKLVQDGLSDADAKEVEFVSISRWTHATTPPSVCSNSLRNFHGVDWPHLSGDQSRFWQDVYNYLWHHC